MKRVATLSYDHNIYFRLSLVFWH